MDRVAHYAKSRKCLNKEKAQKSQGDQDLVEIDNYILYLMSVFFYVHIHNSKIHKKTEL